MSGKTIAEARIAAEGVLRAARVRFRQDCGPGRNFVLEPLAEEYIVEEIAVTIAALNRAAK